jgi:FkbM family methyltransferase
VARWSALFVEGFRFVCAAERAVDALLARAGIARRYYSQKGQDRWVVERTGSQRNGYFVEVGAGDGRTHSNTYALERDHGWIGLLIEPNPAYAASIQRMRTASLVCECADRLAGKADFIALGYMGGLIGEDTDYAPSRRASILRRHADKVFQVSCRRLEDILESAGAPPEIDYLSMDVEGAEFRILADFPFERFRFGALTVERPTKAVHDLLVDAGYVLDRLHLYDGFYLPGDRVAQTGRRSFSGTPRKFF